MVSRIAMLAVALILGACGESSSLTCDEGPYQLAVRAPRVQPPEGLDSLDPINEMPLPAASPQAPRPADGPCLEQPPEIIKIE